MIEVQEASQPFCALDRPIVVLDDGLRFEQPVFEPLVGTLGIVMFHVFLNDKPEMLVSQRDNVIETLATD